jgi:hypothetical protein
MRVEPHDISKELAEVGRSYYFAEQPGFVRDLMQWAAKVVRSIVEFFREIFRHDQGAMDSHGMSFLLQVAIWAVGIVGVGLLAWALIYRARHYKKLIAQQVRGAADVEELHDSAGWKRQAEALAQQEDYKGACRAVYLSLLQDLHERGVAEFAPARTNYEYSYALSRHPQIQQRFRVVADRVELIWFGDRDATGDDYQSALRDLCEMDSEMQMIESQRLGEKVALT